MSKEPCLLNQIKSKYILQKILIVAFKDTKSLFKFIKFDKKLINKLEINIKDHFEYKINTIIIKEFSLLIFYNMIYDFFLFILYLIYLILFYAKGKFNEKNLKEKYDIEKKNFVDIMDNYFLFSYLIFIILSFILSIMINHWKKIIMKSYLKIAYSIFIFIIDLSQYLLFIIKFCYTKNILRKESKDIWFYKFDVALIVILSIWYFTLVLLLCLYYFEGPRVESDYKYIYLNKINGININGFNFSSEFEKLNKNEIIKYIFKKENMKKYKYILKDNQINLIRKINDIRRKNNIKDLKFNEIEQLPEFIINEKTQITLNKSENIYKLSSYYYIFSYPKNKFENYLNKKEILNIITNDYLKKINIIEKNNFDLISIYNNIPNNNIIITNNINNRPNISIKGYLSNIGNASTEDRLNNMNLNVTGINNE